MPSVASAPDSAPPLTWSARQIGDWVLGVERIQRRSVLRLLLSAQAYGLGLLLLGLAAYHGLLPAWQFHAMAAYSVAGVLAFYVVLRSGCLLPLKEPTLALPQVLFGIGGITLSYGLTELTRGPSLLMLCLLLVFDMQRLELKAMQWAARGAIAMLVAVLAATWVWAPQHHDLRAEALNLAMATVMLPVLSILGRELHGIRQRQQVQKQALTETLARLHRLSTHDSLSGQYNRRHMMAVLDREVRRKDRTGGAFSVALLDIDHFKHINDAHGHGVGDAVLRDFAALAKATLGETDALARWGGEEFLVLFPETTSDQALEAMARLRAVVAVHDWAAHAPGLAVRFSAGVACHAGDGTLDLTLERADLALYQAKGQGRDRALAAC